MLSKMRSAAESSAPAGRDNAWIACGSGSTAALCGRLNAVTSAFGSSAAVRRSTSGTNQIRPANELAIRMQEARSALYLLCADDTVDLAAALARRVWSTRPTDGRDDRRAEFRETLDLLRRFTHQLRQEIARS